MRTSLRLSWSIRPLSARTPEIVLCTFALALWRLNTKSLELPPGVCVMSYEYHNMRVSMLKQQLARGWEAN